MNGIIINDELHELASLKTSDPCDNCSWKNIVIRLIFSYVL